MRRTTWLLTIVCMTLGGCATWTSPTPLNQPYFSLEPGEVKAFQVLARKQESLAAKCSETNSCDHVYFTRALLGLYESREVAEKYFGKVLAVAPKSQLAASSKAWIQLLQESAVPRDRSWAHAVLIAPALEDANEALTHMADRLVRDLLDREVILQQLRTTKDGDSQTVETLQRELAERDRKIEALLSRKDGGKGAPEPTAVQSLQKQLAEREKKIEELSTQLEALKRIDQEMREKVRPIRPPSTTPVPTPDTTQ
jgi:bacterioferritin (cytochrome b1)